MAGALSEQGLMLQIQCLVCDSLQVVSYKWLSRNFSLSSNAAKRFLQKFVNENENLEIEVVYAISGWTKKEPYSYVVQLAPKAKVEEAQDMLKGTPSVHVYSVQRCLPKDPAQLWSADFVQAEQLFNEAADIGNCLRDNRFSAVTCPLVQRSLARKTSGAVVPPEPQPSVAKEAAINLSSILAQKVRVPSPPENSTIVVKDAAGARRPVLPSMSSKVLHTDSKDSSGSGATGKKKAPATTGGSGGGGSLASMWGKAPSKPKALSPPKAVAVGANPPFPHGSAGDAEAQILAVEAEVSSEDDMATEFSSLRRGQVSNNGGRRRRMVVNDDSGDEDDDSETIIRLGTPDSPQERKPATIATLSREGGGSPIHGESLFSGEDVGEVDVKPARLEPKVAMKTETEGRRIAEEKPVLAVNEPDAAKGGSKRKKVMKTHLDERGREVTEVLWEIEGVNKENFEKDMTPVAKRTASSSKQTDVKPPVERPQSLQKSSMAPAKSNAGKINGKSSGKATGKPGKGQGNIMSFFKKS